MKKNKNSLQLPLPAKKWLAIIDRDATIFSSWELAYTCYEEAFDRVISRLYPDSQKLSKEEYTREFNPFDIDKVLKKHYPELSEEDLDRVNEVRWQFYLDNFRERRFNEVLPGVKGFLKKFKEKGNLIAVLTTSEGDESYFHHYGLPFDEIYSMVKLKKEGMIEGGKREAIFFIIDRFNWSLDDVVTIGDRPGDHIDEILSIGVGYGLGSHEAQEELRNSVDIYVPTVGDLHRVFGLSEEKK